MTLIKSKLERVQLTDTKIEVVMPEKVLQQIKYLCREIAKVEWSGILFYKVEGSIKDPENMKIILEDILPMHKGTQAYTEYTFDERVVEHMMENEHLEDCKIGHIHSHNTMGVFFSGTDWSELEDNAPNHNFYLSLIVNNFMDFCAKVCFIAEPTSLKAKDESGAIYNFGLKAADPEQKLIVYDCDIKSPSQEIEVEQSFQDKVVGIIKDAAERTVVTTTNNSSYYTSPTGYGGGAAYSMPSSKLWGEDWEEARWEKAYKKEEQKKEEVEIEDLLEDKIEDFSIYVLNIEGTSRVFHNITDVVKYHKSKYINGRVLAKGVLDSYWKSYTMFFEDTPEMNTEDMFTRVTEEVISNYEDERDSSTLPYMDDMLNYTIDGLGAMLRNFKAAKM